MGKCWIYNELADIPDEFIIIERSDEMFDDLKRILERKGWTKTQKKQLENYDK